MSVDLEADLNTRGSHRLCWSFLDEVSEPPFDR